MDSFLDYRKQRSIPQAMLFYVATLGGMLILLMLVFIPLVVFGVMGEDEVFYGVQLAAIVFGAYLAHRIRKDKGYEQKDVFLKTLLAFLVIGFLSPLLGFMVVAAYTLDEDRNQSVGQGAPTTPIPPPGQAAPETPIPPPEGEVK